MGSNLGDRIANLRAAVSAIGEMARIAKVSSVYETDAVGPPQPDYLNAAILIEFEGTPLGLLDALLSIEQRMGRVRRERWGPRVIDLDILWIDGVTVSEPQLTVPHPRLAERAFAWAPLREIAPEAIAPQGELRGVRSTAERLD